MYINALFKILNVLPSSYFSELNITNKILLEKGYFFIRKQ